MIAAALQLRVGEDREENLGRAAALIDQAAAAGAQLFVLPECFAAMGPIARFAALAEPVPGPSTELLAAKARQHDVVICGGSVIEALPGGGLANTMVVFDGDGDSVAQYSKVHLFDVAVDDAAGAAVLANESSVVRAGDELVVVGDGDCRLGLSICYDLRFTELYRALAAAGATILVVPAAFADATGRAHWQVLLRARAIENGAFVIAAAQHGQMTAWPMHGHSMIVSPWGEVLAEIEAGDGVCLAEIDLAEVARRRRQLPVLEHRRPAVYRRVDARRHPLAFSRQM